MSDRPRLLLIWPYRERPLAEAMPIPFGYLVPPLQSDWDITIIDCALAQTRPDSDLFAAMLRQASPDVVGLSVWTQSAAESQDTISAVRRLLPGAAIVVGGPHITAAGELLGADFGVVGEAERSFARLLNGLAAKSPTADLEAIPGVRFAGQRREVPMELATDLDSLGVDYAGMLLTAYMKMGHHYRSERGRQAPILATRGCPYTCGFCSAPMLSGRKIRSHSIAYLEALIQHLVEGYGAGHINVVDDNFTFYPAYVKAFCEMVERNREKLGPLTFATPNGIRLERSDREMFQAMRRAGWSSVIFAPETGSQRLSDVMHKNMRLEVVPERLAWAREAGLLVEAFLIVNYPGETDADVDETEAWLRRLRFDRLSIHGFTPLPHTPIWHELVESGQIPSGYTPADYDRLKWVANGRTHEQVRAIAARYLAAVGQEGS